VAAWCFACSGPPSILANMITSMAMFNNENYVPERWHTSLIMIACMIIPFIFNLWFRRVLDTFEITGGVLHVGLFIVFIVVLIVFGPRSSPDFVFKTLIWQDSGWNNKGVSWGLGLLSMTFSVTGADSVLHMCTFPAESLTSQMLMPCRRRSKEGPHACASKHHRDLCCQFSHVDCLRYYLTLLHGSSSRRCLQASSSPLGHRRDYRIEGCGQCAHFASRGDHLFCTV